MKYGQGTDGFIRGLNSGIARKEQIEGYGPGATETSWLYDVTLGPLVKELETILKSNTTVGIVSTIIDDISMASDFENIIDALKHIEVNGKKSVIKLILIKHNMLCARLPIKKNYYVSYIYLKK